MKTDIEIAQGVALKKISEIAKAAKIPEQALEPYGHYKAKVNPALIKSKKKGALVLVTAINPTAAGEGKTTMSIGLADGLKKHGKNVCLALREPSLGPVFGVKGGATGGGMSQVLPMEEINLHFNGDLHAITSANNLLCALIDNHLNFGNELKIDTRKIVFKRCVDLNDRSLRSVVLGLGQGNGVAREDGFDITAACEIMAVLCLASSLSNLKERIGNIVIAYNNEDKPVYARDIHAQEALTILLKEAIKPNLVQTIEGTPALVHGGPFANIAHGCNSIIATKTALSLADIVVTEAGFGADLGAEKFLDIKCRIAELAPSAVVIVATVRALKLHGGADKTSLIKENLEALKKGLENLAKHVENIKLGFKLPCVVALNRFITDTKAENDTVLGFCKELGVEAVLCEVWEKGGEGGKELAKKVCSLIESNAAPSINFTYELKQSVKEKITAVAMKIYGAKGVTFSDKAEKEISRLTANGYGELPVCIAKTQYSLSDNAKLLGRPKDFIITVKEIRLRAGAGFIVAECGDIMLMPGLPKRPAANNMTIDEAGVVAGLF